MSTDEGRGTKRSRSPPAREGGEESAVPRQRPGRFPLAMSDLLSGPQQSMGPSLPPAKRRSVSPRREEQRSALPSPMAVDEAVSHHNKTKSADASPPATSESRSANRRPATAGTNSPSSTGPRMRDSQRPSTSTGAPSAVAQADIHSSEGTSVAYQYTAVSQITAGRENIEYQLTLREQPKHSRMCGVGEKADRRPIDPAPIIQLRVITHDGPPGSAQMTSESSYGQVIGTGGSTSRVRRGVPVMTDWGEGWEDKAWYLENPYYFMYAMLADAETDEELHLLQDGKTRYTTGSCVSCLYHLKDIDGSHQGFFVFPDLSIRVDGRYRLKLCLFETIGHEVHHCKSIFSDPFNVFTAKRFPGMEESTLLSKSFADQGLKVRVRKNPRLRRGRAGNKRKDGDYSDDSDGQTGAGLQGYYDDPSWRDQKRVRSDENGPLSHDGVYSRQADRMLPPGGELRDPRGYSYSPSYAHERRYDRESYSMMQGRPPASQVFGPPPAMVRPHREQETYRPTHASRPVREEYAHPEDSHGARSRHPSGGLAYSASPAQQSMPHSETRRPSLPFAFAPPAQSRSRPPSPSETRSYQYQHSTPQGSHRPRNISGSSYISMEDGSEGSRSGYHSSPRHGPSRLPALAPIRSDLRQQAGGVRGVARPSHHGAMDRGIDEDGYLSVPHASRDRSVSDPMARVSPRSAFSGAMPPIPDLGDRRLPPLRGTLAQGSRPPPVRGISDYGRETDYSGERGHDAHPRAHSHQGYTHPLAEQDDYYPEQRGESSPRRGRVPWQGP
ncbi:Velvet factor [Ceraceosorus bombacis]|uniref:Velvet factor n=1 Tax=Ceraceosorus bombacis TaxID=401625 RepID=A0A0P1BCM3_9BASI|nr:Velvet factor [Ceraceosorus bombacis]